MSAFLELDQLQVNLGGRPILKDLTGAFAGRCIGLLGPNGAGKTTLLQTLLGFHRPASGTARVCGLDVRANIREIRHQLGYMPETDAYIAGMSAIRLVRLMAELSGLPAKTAMERAHETLFFAGLGEARYRKLGTYSLGMKQMAKLAAAIVHGPRMLILDEPTNGLDPPGRQRMISLIKEIRDAGQTNLILSSHLLRDVEECCDEVMIMKDGRIANYCNLEEQRRANKKFLRLETRGDNAPFLEAVERMGCECAVDGRTRRIKMVLPEAVEIRNLYEIAETHAIQIRRLDYKRDSLQDIFLKAMEDADGRLQTHV
ncbi:MAG: ABC transporter ATP-binding protein [Acidobacteria bacterium]|nr:ABC transporter ATP-binding protein [Acidobacteriota bacterium]